MPTSESRTDVLVGRTDAATCGACSHPLHEHDPLGVRYCAATTTFALPRGCICS
jgi:hypothetical protein